METNSKNTVVPIWLVIVMAVMIFVLMAFIIVQQFLPLLTVSESPTITPTPSASIGGSTIKEISMGQSFSATNSFMVKFVGISYAKGEEFIRYNTKLGDLYYGLPSGNIILILRVRIENFKQTPQSYYHFARCFIKGSKMPCVALKKEMFSENGQVVVKSYHDEVTSEYYEGEVDGGRSVEIELLFSVPASTPRKDKSNIEFDYYCDTTEQSFKAKQEQGLYPEMCRLKVG